MSYVCRPALSRSKTEKKALTNALASAFLDVHMHSCSPACTTQSSIQYTGKLCWHESLVLIAAVELHFVRFPTNRRWTRPRCHRTSWARHYSPWYFVCNVLNPLPASVDCRHYLTHFTPSQCPSCQDFPKATQQTQMLNYFACVHPPCRGKELTLHFFGFAPRFC